MFYKHPIPAFMGKSMKRIKRSIIIVMICSVLLISCGVNNKNAEFIGDISGNSDIEQTQSYFIEYMHKIAKCPTGYYYLSETENPWVNKLNYYDSNSEESVELCNKPQCEHNTNECMAYIDTSEYKRQIYYYNSYLYMIKLNGDIVRISPDGTQRELLGNVCVFTESDMLYASFNGNMIYLRQENTDDISGDVNVNIYGFNLDTLKSEKTYSETAYGLGIRSLRTYAGNTYFVKTEVAKDENGLYTLSGKGLYRINGDKEELVLDDNVYCYCIDSEQSNIYYSRIYDTGIYVYNTVNGESRKIYEDKDGNQFFTMTFDGEYIWLDNTGWRELMVYFNKKEKKLNYTIYKMDKEGQVISKRVLQDDDKISSIMHGDKEKIFMFSSKYDGIVYIDKSNLADGEIKELK